MHFFHPDGAKRAAESEHGKLVIPRLNFSTLSLIPELVIYFFHY